ncbi:hypothetical protein GQ42DRAFT_15613 [Ramicandelaber brevisporus]|nr:hypothetical protein GQ42DRAFT_15613 [Ramicandelaber brevisporus]
MLTKRASISGVEPAADHFRLRDLPFDLRECVSQFVDRRTAARLLTLSSGFHELFARSVWRCINQRVFDSNVSNETRTSALTRYGRFVRCVDIRLPLDGLDHSIDLSQLLPNVTVYKFDVGKLGSSKEHTLHLIQAVSGFHGLRSLEVAFDTNHHQFCLESVADALISRQQNLNWQRLQRLKLDFIQHDYDCSWDDMVDFVVKVTPLQIDEFEITTKRYAYGYPTAEQMVLLSPHLTTIPDTYGSVSRSLCRAHHNRIIYRLQNPSGNDEAAVFSQLESLRISLCCASSAVYDYADFTPTKFPRVDKLDITIFNCEQDTMSTDPDFVHPVLSQCWPTVSNMKFDGITTSSALHAILDLNPQVTNLHVETVYIGLNTTQSNRFSLADILKRLPMLDTLYITLDEDDMFYGNSANDTNGSEDRCILHIKNSQLRDIQVTNLVMTSDCLEMLYMLPKLEEIKIRSCSLDDPEAVLETFKRIQQLNNKIDSGKYGDNIVYIKFGGIYFDINDCWSIEMVIAITAAAPNIYEIEFDDYTSELISAVRKYLPNVDLPLEGFRG